MEKGKQDFSGNIPWYYAMVVFRSFFLLVSINVLYYLAHSISFTQILVLGGALSLGVVLFEIPTGAVADMYGRKASMLISGGLIVLGYILLAFGRDFWMFFAAMIVMALSMSFLSGADSAFIYDTLVQQGKEHSYFKVEKTAQKIGFVSMGLAAILGSLFYAMNIYYPYYAMVIFACVSFLCTIPLREPPQSRAERQTFRNFFRHIRNVGKDIKRHRALLALFLFYAGLMTATQVAFRFFQPLMREAGIALESFGFVYALLVLPSAVLLHYADYIERKLRFDSGSAIMLWILPVWLGLAFLLSISPYVILLCLGLFFIQFMGGYLTPLVLAQAQPYFRTEDRATSISAMSFSGNILLLALSPLFGFIAESFSIALALVLLGALSVIVGLGSALWHREAGIAGGSEK